MTDPGGHPRYEVKVTATDHFPWLRTRLAVEHIMAWLLTASLIGFGFAIVQFFERMR